MKIEWKDEELQQALTSMMEKIPENTAEAVEKASLAVEAEAKERCPHNTGMLRQSISTEVKREGSEIVGIVGTTLDYAPFIHQGTGIYAREGNGRKEVPWVYFDEATQKFVSTKGVKPTPFLDDAMNALQPQILDYFKGVLDNA